MIFPSAPLDQELRSFESLSCLLRVYALDGSSLRRKQEAWKRALAIGPGEIEREKAMMASEGYFTRVS